MKILSVKSALSLLILTLVSHAAQARVGQDGNGGGGICVNDRCLTIAEAGLKIKPQSSQEYWLIPSDVLGELQSITNSLPFAGSDMLAKTLGSLETFQTVESIDSSRFRRIIRQYEQVIRENQFTAPGKLELYALSTADSTYLLPQFFKLSPRQQALILIHEGNVRVRSGNPQATLVAALEFDELLLAYLKGSTEDHLRFLGSLKAMASRHNHGVNLWAEVVEYFYKKNGRPLTLENFRDTELVADFYQVGIVSGELSSIGQLALIKSAQTIDSRFVSIFGGASMTTTARLTTTSAYRQGNFTLHEFKIPAAEVCRANPNRTGWSRFALLKIPVQGYNAVYAADCTTKQKDGTYLGVGIYMTEIRLGNRTH